VKTIKTGGDTMNRLKDFIATRTLKDWLVTAVTLILLAGLTVGGIILSQNADTIAQGLAGVKLYTADDIAAACAEGYETKKTELERLTATVESLRAQLISEQKAAEKRYNDMVADYEERLDGLQSEILRLNSYADALSDYVFEITAGDLELDSVEALTAVLNLYETLLESAQASKASYESELGAMSDLVAEKAQLAVYNAELMQINHEILTLSETIRQQDFVADFLYKGLTDAQSDEYAMVNSFMNGFNVTHIYEYLDAHGIFEFYYENNVYVNSSSWTYGGKIKSIVDILFAYDFAHYYSYASSLDAYKKICYDKLYAYADSLRLQLSAKRSQYDAVSVLRDTVAARIELVTADKIRAQTMIEYYAGRIELFEQAISELEEQIDEFS
jgi:hypothetical protein